MSDFQRNEFWKRRRIERQLRSQLRTDAEIPDQVYRSAGKAYKMILDGTVRQEAIQDHSERRRVQDDAELCGVPESEDRKQASPQHAALPAAQFRQKKPKHGASPILFRTACSAAAVLLVCVLANAVFPAQVRALPIVGSIFEQIQDAVGYENLSEYAKPLTEKVDGSADPDADMQDYTDTNGGLTVSVSEVYADSEVIYLAMKLKSEEPFPKSFYLDENDTEKIDGIVAMFLYARRNYSFIDQESWQNVNDRSREFIVEGLMVNENTYEFLWRIDVANELAWYRRQVDQEAVLPDEFTMDIEITQINSLVSMEKSYRGPWKLSIPIQVDDSHREVVEVNETGGTGAGLVSVEKTPFEITTRAITPGPAGYKVVVLDAKGNKLPYVLQNENWFGESEDEMYEKWLIEGHDAYSVEVFVLGKDFYENIYATGIWSSTDWEGNENKSAEEKLGTLLKAYAEYHKVIRFDS